MDDSMDSLLVVVYLPPIIFATRVKVTIRCRRYRQQEEEEEEEMYHLPSRTAKLKTSRPSQNTTRKILERSL